MNMLLRLSTLLYYFNHALWFLSRDEPEDADQTLEEEEEEEEEDDAALLDVASDEAMEAMIESNEIPDNEGPVRMEGKF